MNRFALLLCTLLFALVSKSQIKALTENGREVLLSTNGTWKYAMPDSSNANVDSFGKQPSGL